MENDTSIYKNIYYYSDLDDDDKVVYKTNLIYIQEGITKLFPPEVCDNGALNSWILAQGPPEVSGMYILCISPGALLIAYYNAAIDKWIGFKNKMPKPLLLFYYPVKNISEEILNPYSPLSQDLGELSLIKHTDERIDADD